MNSTIIINLLNGLEIPSRLLQIISWYLASLMISADKHTQSFASLISGKASSLFSNLLLSHLPLSKMVLNRAARRRLQSLMRKRKKLHIDTPWTIAIIIDATLHERSSKYIENVQKFNHGKGYVLGHQWTNIGVFISGQYIPLPPIPFFTEEESTKRNKNYKTEQEKVAEFLRTLDLNFILGDHDKSEIVFLMDSGYDCKKIQNIIINRGWDFIGGIKSSRSISKDGENWIQISTCFKDGRRSSSKTIRILTNGGKIKKWKTYFIKQLEGNLKGVKHSLKLVCSKRKDGAIKYFSCSNLEVEVNAIFYVYQKRWAIELFHRAIKSYLGLEDAGVQKFDALNSHVHWVYIAYIFLHDLYEDGKNGVKEKQMKFEAALESQFINSIIHSATKINGVNRVKKECSSAIARIKDRYGQI